MLMKVYTNVNENKQIFIQTIKILGKCYFESEQTFVINRISALAIGKIINVCTSTHSWSLLNNVRVRNR